MEIGFGDRVKFIDSESTQIAGVANKDGECTGHTTPSVTGIEYIGDQGDFALSIMFEDGTQIWSSPEQLNLLDHNEGLVIEVGNLKATKNADGTWKEEIKKSKGNWFTRLFNK